MNRCHAFVIAATASCLLTACYGPTERGIESRRSANERFDRANAQIGFDQAKQALINGQYKLALSTIEQAIQRFPRDANYLAFRGRVLQEMRQHEAAQRTLELALSIDPACHECHYYLGIEAQRRSEDELARQHYDDAWMLEPTRLQYATAAIESCIASGDLEEADERLCIARQFLGNTSALSALEAELHAMYGDDARALVMAKQAAIQSGDASSEEAIWKMFRASDWRGCLDALAKPTAAKVAAREDMVRLRARCLIMTGAAREARDVLVATDGTASASSDEHTILLGTAAWSCGDWACVQRCADSLLAANTQSIDGRLFRGAAAYVRGDWEAAELNLAEAERLAPNRTIAKSLRQRVAAARLLSVATDNEQVFAPTVTAGPNSAPVVPEAPLLAHSASIPFAE